MKFSIPQNMQALVLKNSDSPVCVDKVPTPIPGAGQVLVKIEATPVNPSDIGFIGGTYGAHTKFPVIPGFEGSGTVVKAGSGLLPRFMLGRRVAIASGGATGGAWAQYLVAPVSSCIPLGKKIPFDLGAMSIVNPMTALAFMDIMLKEHHRAIVNTAAAGALGKMMIRLAGEKKITVINTVRRKEQIEILKSIGAEYIVNTSDPDYFGQLSGLIKKLKPTLILDAIGGEVASRLCEVALPGTQLIRYGYLSGIRTMQDDDLMRAKNINVRSFFLPHWLGKQGVLKKIFFAGKISKEINRSLSTVIQKEFYFTQIDEALNLYRQNRSDGKIILKPDP